MDDSVYLEVDENHTMNTWFNDTIHGEMKQSLFSSKDMREFYTVNTVFGSKMIPTVE